MGEEVSRCGERGAWDNGKYGEGVVGGRGGVWVGVGGRVWEGEDGCVLVGGMWMGEKSVDGREVCGWERGVWMKERCVGGGGVSTGEIVGLDWVMWTWVCAGGNDTHLSTLHPCMYVHTDRQPQTDNHLLSVLLGLNRVHSGARPGLHRDLKFGVLAEAT